METSTAPNHRASLLAGLRTGGVRSTSATIPHTAAPGGSFNVPRIVSQNYPSSFPEEEETQFVEIPVQNGFVNHSGNRAPMTAAVDGPNNRFSQHMSQRGMNPHSTPFTPASFSHNVAPQPQPTHLQNQALQMQMLQLEMMRIQNLQAQQMQMQAEMIAQAQAQRQQQQAQIQSQLQAQNRRSSLGFNPPSTAGPTSNSFDLRAATLSAQMRRANQEARSQLGVSNDEQLPMTAALGGKFGSRTMSLSATGAMSKYSPEEYDDSPPPPTPGSTTVISGGTSLGNPIVNNSNGISPVPSKSDSATSWRRGGNNNSVLSGNNRTVSSPTVRVTPPPTEERRVSPPPSVNTAGKFRPQPLRFSVIASQPLPVTVENSDNNINDDDSSSSSAASNSSPTTPRSSSSSETPLSPREEASKKLYEGLGIGRPASGLSDHQQQTAKSVVSHRVASQPTRQPRGPPSGADELGPKNFASRIRRKAIGGLGMLMGARERREFVEAY